MLCDRWCGCEKYREYIEPWVKYRKSNRKLKICIVPSLVFTTHLGLNDVYHVLWTMRRLEIDHVYFVLFHIRSRRG